MKLYAVIGGFFALVACDPVEEAPDSGLAGFDPNLVENQRAVCEQSGGRFSKGGLSGVFVCYQDTGEVNKSCSSSNDCKGYCLARSRTCAPVTPMFGCQEVLGKFGASSTLCLE